MNHEVSKKKINVKKCHNARSDQLWECTESRFTLNRCTNQVLKADSTMHQNLKNVGQFESKCCNNESSILSISKSAKVKYIFYSLALITVKFEIIDYTLHYMQNLSNKKQNAENKRSLVTGKIHIKAKYKHLLMLRAERRDVE